MGFISLMPFLLLILIPLVILLYLLRQKAEDVTVPSLFLWREAYKNTEAAAPWEKLKKNLLMLAQIATILCIILALASPYLKGSGEAGGHILLAVDVSGSMNIEYSEGESRFLEAIRRAEECVDSFKEGTAFTILSIGKNAVIQGTNISSREEAKDILQNIQVTDSQGDLEGGLNLMSSITSQWESYEMFFFSDQPVDFQGMNGRFVDVNSIVLNGCIDYLSYGETEDGLMVLVRVSNPSPFLLETDVNLYVDERLVDIGFVSLNPGESEILYFEGVAAAGRLLMAELNESDGLSKDNRAYGVLEPAGHGDILLVSEGNLFVEKGIRSLKDVTLYRTNSPENIGPEDVFDLYIFDGMVPEVIPNQGNLIFLGIGQDYDEWIKVDEVLENVYISAAAHEITRYLEDFTLGVTRAYGYERPAWSKSIFTRDGISIGFAGENDGRFIAVVGFDFHNSDFPLQMEFPIFIHNLVSQSLRQGLVTANAFTAGSRVDLNPSLSGGDIYVTHPKGAQTTIPLQGFNGSYSETDEAGPYYFRQLIQDDVLEGIAIAAFPTDTESIVREYETLAENGYLTDTKAAVMGRELRTALIAAALLLLMAEWFLYLKDL